MARLRPIQRTDLSKVTEAFPYQKEAIDVVRGLPYAAIFFEQGLGKTKIAIDLILDWLRSGAVDTVIVVTKKGLVRNWIEEFSLHSRIRPRVISSDRAANHRAFFSRARVYIANYEAVALEEERLRSLSRHRRLAVILDESQKIKNPTSGLTQSFFRLSGIFEKKLIMTGTPMANRPFDIWAQICFLDDGASLGQDFEKFRTNLDIPTNKESREGYTERLAEVFPKISKFAIRQTKAGSGLELPGKVYEVGKAQWEQHQRTMYDQVRTELKVELLRDGKYVVDDTEDVLKRLLRLVQISSNPGIIDESYDQVPGKVEVLDRLLEDITGRGEKAIVWTSFVRNCQYLGRHLRRYQAVQIHGSMSVADRDRSVQKFKRDKDVRTLVATPAAAKEGLTLTVANHVIFFDRSFSLDDYVQAQDRIHRISQTKTCYVHNIVLPDSIDEWVGALIALKGAAATVGMGDSDAGELEVALETDVQQILCEVLND